MILCERHCWKPACKDHMLLVIDTQQALLANALLTLLEECNTDAASIPGCWFYRDNLSIALLYHYFCIAGSTGLVQPLDASFNKPFKAVIERISNQHMPENLDTCDGRTDGKHLTLHKVGGVGMGVGQR